MFTSLNKDVQLTPQDIRHALIFFTLNGIALDHPPEWFTAQAKELEGQFDKMRELAYVLINNILIQAEHPMFKYPGFDKVIKDLKAIKESV